VTDIAATLAPDALDRIATAQADWVRRHRRVALACSGGLLILAAGFAVVLLVGTRDTVSPQAVLVDGVLMGLVASVLAAAIGQARYAERARKLAVDPPAPVACHIERLGADTKKRADHVSVRVGDGPAVLVRAEAGSEMHLLPERGDGIMLGALRRNRPVLLGVPGRPFIAGRRA
jgi:hypothetical protein